MRTFADDNHEDKASIDDVRCVGETEKAIKVTLGEDTWMPKSAVHEDSEVYQLGDMGRLVVRPWFAQKMGWELD